MRIFKLFQNKETISTLAIHSSYKSQNRGWKVKLPMSLVWCHPTLVIRIYCTNPGKRQIWYKFTAIMPPPHLLTTSNFKE